MKLKIILLLFLCYSLTAQSQSLNNERIRKIKNCSVRILIDSIPVGTEFIINDQGLTLTCWHVASLSLILNANGSIGYKNMFIENGEGVRTLMGVSDYFMLKGNLSAVAFDYCLIVPKTLLKFKCEFLPLGFYNDVQEGDEVYTCGYPLGMPQSFISKGIVSTKYVLKDNFISDNKGLKTLMPRNQMLLDMTLNRGNSGGAIIKIGATPADDRVVAIADFIISPIGGMADKLIKELSGSTGGVFISGVDPNKTLLMLTQVLTNTSIGISGAVSINHFTDEFNKATKQTNL